MKKSLQHKIVYVASEVIYFVIMALYLFVIKECFSQGSTYESFLFLGIIAILGIIILALPAFLNRYLVFGFSFCLTIYLISQNIYYRAFKQYYRFDTVFNLYKEAIAAGDSAIAFIRFTDILPIIVLILITVLFIVYYHIFLKKLKKPKAFYHLLALVFIIPLAISFKGYGSLVTSAKANNNAFDMSDDEYYVYDVIPSTNQFAERFGVLTLGYRDITSFFEDSSIDRGAIAEYLNARPEHKDNALSGIFKDKDIFIIQAESFNDIVVDPELTPTLYRIKEASIQIKGFNTPALSGSTSDTEFMANTSLIPDVGGACYKYAQNTFKTTLPQIFKAAGYETIAFHNNYGSYYNRDNIFLNFGYDAFFDCTDMGLKDTSDDETVGNIMQWILLEKERYLAYWITYNGHQPYTLDSVGVESADVEKIRAKYPDLSDEYVAYFAKNMQLDRFLASMFVNYEYAQKMEDTVFVFFGDHIVKDLSFSEDSDFYKQTGITYDEDLTKTDLFIYNSANDALVYDKVATALDILPTLANMWAIDIDYKTILGSDIFDEDYQGLYFSAYGYWESDEYSFDELSGTLEVKGDLSKEEAKEAYQEDVKLRNISYDILNSDYFKE